MKTCARCGVEKSLTDFSVRNVAAGTRQRWCKECFREYDRNRYLQPGVTTDRQSRKKKLRKSRLDWYIDLKKSFQCVDCGIDDWRLLEFDHIGTDKEGNVGTLFGAGASRERIMAEVEKCEPVCANCHRLRTWKRRQP